MAAWESFWANPGWESVDVVLVPGTGAIDPDVGFRFIFTGTDWPHITGDGIADLAALFPGPWTVAMYHTLDGDDRVVVAGPAPVLLAAAVIGAVPAAEQTALDALVGG